MSVEQDSGELLRLNETGGQKPEKQRNHRVAKAVGWVALGGLGVATALGAVVYKRDYVATDNCTGLDKQAVSVLDDWSVSDISRRLHNPTDSLRSTAVNLNDVVEAQQRIRGYTISVDRVAEINGINDASRAFSVGVVCLEGFGPEIDNVNGQALVEGAPVSSLWAATDGMTSGGQAKLIGASAKANADKISQQHGFPATGTYPFAQEFYDNILATPGMTDQAKANFRQEVADAGLAPIG